MATKRIKDLTNTAASVASDAYLAIDGTSNGTEKITRDNFRQDTANAFVAAPGTYNLAPLSGGAVEVAKGGTGSTTAAGARTNLSVNSIDEDAQANALKTTAPALYFNGTSSVVTVADDDKLSFTDGVDDLPFTISAFVKASDWSTNAHIVSKYGSSSPAREFLFGADVSGYLRLIVIDSAGTDSYILSNASMTSYNGEYVHVAVSYPGAGPNSSDSFSAATTGAKMFVNGSEISATAVPDPSYTGMSNSSQAVYLGRASSAFFKGSIRGVKIFNRELTSTEIAELARGNDLGFSDEWGGANGAVYTSDFSAGADGWGGVNGTAAGNIDAIGGQDDNLRLTLNTSSSQHYLYKGSLFTTGKRYRLKADFYIPSTNSNMDGIQAQVGTSSATVIQGFVAPTLDTWNKITGEFIATAGSNPDRLSFYGLASASTTFADAGGDDVLYIRNVTITEIGALADFRSERYDTSTSKLYDISDNAFVGTGTSVSLTGREQPVYEHGTWTPSISFGGASVGLSASSASGFYTRIGNQCIVRGAINLSAKGSSTGAAKITGLPFTSVGGTSMGSMLLGLTANMSGLTSVPTGQVAGNDTTVDLYDWGATGTSTLNETNFTDTTYLRFSATYQIQ
jgi:hypothetical protein